MLMPKRTKYRKQMRGRMCGMAKGGDKISFGTYALVAEECGWITARQIEASRIAMTRHIKRGGQVWIRIFPDKPFTKKPLEQRMGKGKASVEGWVAVVKPGRVMFEMAGPSPDVAKEAMRLAQHKLPIKCKFMMKEGFQYVPPTKAARAAAVPSPVPFKAGDSKPTTETAAPEEPATEAVAASEE